MVELFDDITPGSFVHRLLRCNRTQRFFQEGGWTENPRRAKVFPDEIAAVRACVQHDLQDIELVLRSSGAGADLFSIPMR